MNDIAREVRREGSRRHSKSAVQGALELRQVSCADGGHTPYELPCMIAPFVLFELSHVCILKLQNISCREVDTMFDCQGCMVRSSANPVAAEVSPAGCALQHTVNTAMLCRLLRLKLPVESPSSAELCT